MKQNIKSYQILRQASQEQTKVPSSQVPLTGMKPSLVALEDASALK